MRDISAARWFRLRPDGVACDGEALRVGGAALLQRDAGGRWASRPADEAGGVLGETYGFAIDISGKARGLDAVAAALNKGDLARAQIAALLLQLPDPPTRGADGAARLVLANDLAASGLLKADADWEAQHPRTGTAPNPGWFAPTDGATTESGSKDPARDAFVTAPAAGPVSWLADKLPETALSGLARLAARLSVATIVFGTLFVPARNRVVDEGSIPGRADLSYRWAHDEAQVSFHIRIDGEWRTLLVANEGVDGLYRDTQGATVARVVAANGRRTLVTELDVLDRAAAVARGGEGSPHAAAADADREPKLCPDPTPEPVTTKSKNSILYQEYVSGLPSGLAIRLAKVNFDGCDPKTGDLLEAKANIDFMFGNDNQLKWFIAPDSDPRDQMDRQQRAAAAAGRLVYWHAQTEKGYQGLSELWDPRKWPNLRMIYDPHVTGFER